MISKEVGQKLQKHNAILFSVQELLKRQLGLESTHFLSNEAVLTLQGASQSPLITICSNMWLGTECV